jgi:glucose/arabinose dehydrogenase
MLNPPLKLLKLAGLLFLSLTTSNVSAQTGAEIYNTYCRGCHGDQMQGGVASALIKERWTYGGDRNSIIKTIADGIPSTNMISWKSALSTKEIEAVTDYILQAQASPNIAKNDNQPVIVNTKLYTLKVETLVTEGLDTPWGIEFVDVNRALITGKNGSLYSLVNGKLDERKITGLPWMYLYRTWGGLMDLALDLQYEENGWIYIAFGHNPTHSSDSGAAAMTKVAKGRVRDYKWVDEQTLFQVPDSVLVSGGTRWGGRFLFDKNGYLYFTVGDMQQAIQHGNNPQLPWRAEGKIFRIHSDGSIPKDNPYYGRKDALQAIYAWGTRNVQGLAQHPVTGEIYFTDHGPRGGDELNMLKPGGNYGWPVITYGVNYDGSVISNQTHKEGMEQPLVYWTPSIAVCAAEFVTGNLFPKWKNNLLVTALKDEEIRRLVIEGDRVVEQEVVLKGYGRVRDVKVGPDGALYVLTNTPDALLRIIPQ